jgi:CheY-like chemotaxis protein
LTIVDDDLLSREVLGLLAEEASFRVECHESGEAALEALAAPAAALPDVILCDLQMPGVSGDSLARLFRAACGPGTVLLAMSGSTPPPERLRSFDAFLLKPFSIDHLVAVIEDRAAVTEDRAGTPAQDPAASGHREALNRSIHAALSQSMGPEQVRQLYAMCLDDADARIATMRQALATGNRESYRRAAHSIKGGAGMVGALELARIATQMETNGLETVPNQIPPAHLLDEFLVASAHLRRILDTLQK